jgi:uncharacterized protein YggE
MLTLALAACATLQQPAAAQTPTPERTIRVAGTGEVQVTPDVARVTLSVETTGQTARQAGEANARTMQQVIDALVKSGIPKDSVETTGYQLFPQYTSDEKGQAPRISNYRATNQIVVTTGRTERVGGIIDTALGAGANRMEGIGFQLRNPEQAQAAALAEAVRRARADAEVMARSLGVTLGPVLDASTSGAAPPPVPMYSAKVRYEAPPAPPTPIQPGEQTVTASVSVVYSIAGS